MAIKDTMPESEKLDNLINDFAKLEENSKDYIRELTGKLVDIQDGKKFDNAPYSKSPINCPKKKRD